MQRALLVPLAVAALFLAALLWAQGWPLPPLAPPAVPPLSAASPSPAADVRVVISQRRLTQEMARALGDNPALRDPALQLLPLNRLRVSATLSTQILGRILSLPVGVTMALAVAEGRATVTPEGVDVGGAPLPFQVVDARLREVARSAEEQINATADRVAEITALRLVAISTTVDGLQLDFN